MAGYVFAYDSNFTRLTGSLERNNTWISLWVENERNAVFFCCFFHYSQRCIANSIGNILISKWYNQCFSISWIGDSKFPWYYFCRIRNSLILIFTYLNKVTGFRRATEGFQLINAQKKEKMLLQNSHILHVEVSMN